MVNKYNAVTTVVNEIGDTNISDDLISFEIPRPDVGVYQLHCMRGSLRMCHVVLTL